ncbi:ribonuclease P protein component 1 [Halorubrum sp. JWXQ-INN 858]|uniref:ribonuclease P protein component 1 n=1 Tax=Halorubrum sp. JWXQ-INN 858 TaxID=2690782 RepID=UPI001359F3B8|nr:ribonuclease P protein component 1 [Halorubrum sp. JWXQ-INN 858]MWV63769.1 ribonuclease P protein component 1 [Halorubrum sp. JWXQ-INN 858]
MITPETLTRHELVGLPVRVADADSDAHVGIAGRVLSETYHTVVVRTSSGDKRVPKSGTTFEFAVVDDATVRTDEAADDGQSSGSTSQLGSDTTGVRPRQSGPSAPGVSDADAASRSGECKDVVYVTVDGMRLRHRPAERTERGVTQWR